MKKSCLLATGLILLFVMAAITSAQDLATKDECVTKCKKAASLIESMGFDAARELLQSQDGEFRWKNTYVFIMDLNGTILTHPVKPTLVGQAMLDLRDANGKMFIAEVLDVARNNGDGWVEYMWPDATGKATPKETYVYRIPDQEYIMCAGVYK